MPQEDLAERLDAVERRLDAAYPEPDGVTTDQTVERVEAFAERLADLEAAVEAVEGYVGEIERVDGELERRADAAIAAAEGAGDRVVVVEQRVDAVEQRADGLEERLDAIEARSDAAPDADDLAALRSELADLEARVGSDGSGSEATSRGITRGGGIDELDEPHWMDDSRRPDEPASEIGAVPTHSGEDPERNGRRHCDCDGSGGVGEPGGTAPVEDATGAARSGSACASDARSSGSRPDVSADRSGPTPSGVPGDDRHAPIGRADGGRPAQRDAIGASADTPTISGWDDSEATHTGEPPGGPRPAAGGHDDQTWTSARSETLLDRLRSLL